VITELGKEILQMVKISKTFGATQALSEVDFDLRKGEVHALVGENGAGKSTLMKILSGIHKMDSGKIILFGEEVHIDSLLKANKLGIRMIHQELNLIPYMNVTQNIFLGHEMMKGKILGNILIDRNSNKIATEKLLKEYELDIPSIAVVKNLSIAQRQMIEIIRTLHLDSNIIIMDEPTSSLTDKEIKKLFEVILRLKSKGKSIIYISHILEEIFEIADRVTILRDGQRVATSEIKDVSKPIIVRNMVGKRIDDFFTKDSIPSNKIIFEIQNLNSPGTLYNINLNLKEGEILGIAGLVGSKRSELAKAIFGLLPKVSGKIMIGGNEVTIKNPQDAIKQGIGYIPEDRKLEGLFPNLSVAQNTSITNLDEIIKFGILMKKNRLNKVFELLSNLGFRKGDILKDAKDLSGGNQQKVVIGKWLWTKARILIFDEPTRGIDVGAKQDIYRKINEMAKNGYSIIFISSELPEVLNMSDRLIVMREGRIVTEFLCNPCPPQQEDVLSAMFFGTNTTDEVTSIGAKNE
jgi:ribose transport system ATP-binding protein